MFSWNFSVAPVYLLWEKTTLPKHLQNVCQGFVLVIYLKVRLPENIGFIRLNDITNFYVKAV